MKSFSALRCVTIVASAGLFALSFGEIARAITSTVFQYSTPRTSYLTLSPGAFSPINSTTANNYGADAGSLAASAGGCFVASVQLPDGARITEVRFWGASDQDPGIDFALQRVTLNTGVNEDMIQMQSHDTSQNRFALHGTVAPGFATIRNASHSYSAVACVDSTGTLFHGFRIAYTVTNAGD